MEKAYRTILIPLDGSKLCGLAVDAALPLAKAFGSRVVLCSAFDFAPERFGLYYELSVPEEFEREIRAHHEDTLNRAHERFVAEGVATTTVIEKGDPVTSILGRARQEGADLIVMASHSRAAVPRFFLGSVTDRVLRQAPCPVLVVRPPEPA